MSRMHDAPHLYKLDKVNSRTTPLHICKAVLRYLLDLLLLMLTFYTLFTRLYIGWRLAEGRLVQADKD